MQGKIPYTKIIETLGYMSRDVAKLKRLCQNTDPITQKELDDLFRIIDMIAERFYSM